MTSTFDELMHLFDVGEKNPRVKEVVNWLADICIPQTAGKEPGWDFEAWKAGEVDVPSFMPNPYIQMFKDDPYQLKKYYLDACHDALDHKNWHLRVFNRETVFLVSLFHEVLFGVAYFGVQHEDDRFLKRKFPDYDKYLKMLLKEREAVKNG